MRKVHEKSIILGIGIGMIITAIAGMIFSVGNQKELSKAEIIRLAKGYGLVELYKFPDDEKAANDSKNTAVESTTANSTAANSSSPASSTETSSTAANNTAANSSSPASSTETSSTTANGTTASSNTATGTVDSSSNGDDLDKQQKGSDNSSSSFDQRNISIEIKDGYKSQHVIDALLEKGVIENKEAFIAMLDSNNASTKINIGTFKFKKNDDLYYIVKTICNLR